MSKTRGMIGLVILTSMLVASVGVSVGQPALDQIVLIQHKQDFVKPPWVDDKKPDKEDKYEGYDFLGRNVKWKDLPIEYVIDPDNPQGLSESFVISAIHAGAEEWDSHTSIDLFGTYTIDHDASWDSDTPDGRNEMIFGDYPQENVIAVAVVWGYFLGNPQMREIIEFDILFDVDFPWGDATIDPSVMDLQNIATHEIGHGIGLADLYDSKYSEETMYGYASYGEIKKRDLYIGDISGLHKLYGD